MQETSWPEFLAWMDWLDDQANHPSPQEAYLMQIAYEVRRLSGERVPFKDFILSFVRSSEPAEKTEEQKQQKMKADKDLWRSMLGVRRRNK